jgi:hypothetical protein
VWGYVLKEGPRGLDGIIIIIIIIINSSILGQLYAVFSLMSHQLNGVRKMIPSFRERHRGLPTVMLGSRK